MLCQNRGNRKAHRSALIVRGFVPEKRRGEKIWKMLAAALAVLLLASLSACSGGKGIMFRAEGWDAEPNVPAGKIRFDSGGIYEDSTPVIERHTFRMYVNFDME